MSALGGWAAVHGTRTGAGVLAATALLAFATGGHGVETWGPVRLPGLVPWVQVLPVLAATGVAGLLSYGVDPSVLVDERATARLQRARVPWALAATAAAALACSAGVLRVGVGAVPVALVNLLLLVGIAVPVVAWGAPELAWLPPSALFLASALFGYPEGAGPDDYFWWAVLFAPTVTPARLLAALAAWTLAVALYTCTPRLLRGRGRFSSA